MDCTTNLQKKSADKKCSCARTKYESVVTKFILLGALEELKNYLKYVNFVTVSCDISNHKHLKQLPILVRYFQAYDLGNQLKIEIFTFVEISRETTDIISMQLMNAIANYDLETEVIRLSTDNINTNFGGLLRKGKEKLLAKMKSVLNRNIIDFGFSADIQNCPKTAFGSMPIDIEVLVTKIFEYFHNTRFVERLNDFYDFIG
jgi:hypothetical protein